MISRQGRILMADQAFIKKIKLTINKHLQFKIKKEICEDLRVEYADIRMRAMDFEKV